MNSNENKNFFDKPFQMVPGGSYDENGFYYTPEGSFWDPDGVHFSSDGLDRHGGFYDENLEYHPGQGWIDELMCYEDEKHQVLGNRQPPRARKNHRGNDDFFDDAGDDLDDIDELYEEVDYDKLMQEDTRRPEEYSRPTQEYSRPTQEYSRPTHDQPPRIHTGRHMQQPRFEPSQEKIQHQMNELTLNTNQTYQPVNVAPELLFNKIPENKKVEIGKYGAESTESVRTEKQIEVDSLFQ